MKRAAPLVLEATVAELAPGGDGVAHAEIQNERRAVFVRGATVGDRVRVEVDASKRPARGRVLELLASGPDRVASPCPHSVRCGGCDWMHVAPAAQAKTHAAHVRAALPPAWRDREVVVHEAAEPLGYRSRARLHVQTAKNGVAVGMHEAKTHEPVEVDRCVVLDPALDHARARIAPLLEGSRGRGEAQISLGSLVLDAARKPVLELRWNGELSAEVFARLERAVAAGEWAGARVVVGDASRPAIVGNPTPWMMGADDRPLRLAPGGFGQASEAMNRALALRVAELAKDAVPSGGKIVELFAGAGNLTVMLAPLGDVIAVESSRDACDAARANLSARALSARVVEADAGAYAWSPSTRLLVLDPPRTGAREVAARIASSPARDQPRHVIYVSCDPQTLGRDLALLAGAGYAPRALETFEMFPQTSHVESVLALERARKGSGS